MRTCRLVTAGECGSSLNAGRHVDERKDAGNRQSQGPGSAAVTLPDCSCGSVGSRRLRMINRAVNPDVAEKQEQAWETRVARKTRKRTSNSS